MKRSKLIIALCIISVWHLSLAVPAMAWQQDAPPLSLSVTADPATAISGEKLILTITLINEGDIPLEQVNVQAGVPEHTSLQGFNMSGEKWAAISQQDQTLVTFSATASLMPEEEVQFGLWLTVHQESGQSITLENYAAQARGFESSVIGSPFTVWVDTTPTPHSTSTVAPTATPTTMPTATHTSTPTGTPTGTPTPTTLPPTATPSPTNTPVPTPSPTITVVMAELPPTLPPPTATPNLSTEEVRLGTLTVSIFVAFTLLLVGISVIWLVKRSRHPQKPDRQ
jgi:hypothetical protein